MKLTFGLSYDDRKNYFTYETMGIVDSLFNDATRYGMRASANLLLPGNYRLFTNAGIRKRNTNSDYTYSYGGGISKYNFVFKNLSIYLNSTGFSNFYNKGFSYNGRIAKFFINNFNIEVSSGGYFYTLTFIDSKRKNKWVQVGFGVLSLKKMFLNGYYEYDWGDDSHGNRFLVEIGYSF